MAGMNDEARGPDTFPAKAAWRRALIIFAGPCANIVAAVAILAIVLMTTGEVTGVKSEVRQVEPHSMAQRVGIKPGDRLVAVDGRRTGGWEGFSQAVAERKPGQEISVTVERNGEERTFTGRLGADPENPGKALVGVRPVVATTRYGPFEAVGMAVGQVVRVTGVLGAFLADLVTGDRSFYNNVAGPVGIASVGSTAVQQGFYPQLLALISVNLAIFNLLPVLPLDGGHLFFIAAEKVLGRPVSAETIAGSRPSASRSYLCSSCSQRTQTLVKSLRDSRLSPSGGPRRHDASPRT